LEVGNLHNDTRDHSLPQRHEETSADDRIGQMVGNEIRESADPWNRNGDGDVTGH
jgi:hypothetical protein